MFILICTWRCFVKFVKLCYTWSLYWPDVLAKWYVWKYRAIWNWSITWWLSFWCKVIWWLRWKGPPVQWWKSDYDFSECSTRRLHLGFLMASMSFIGAAKAEWLYLILQFLWLQLLVLWRARWDLPQQSLPRVQIAKPVWACGSCTRLASAAINVFCDARFGLEKPWSIPNLRSSTSASILLFEQTIRSE